MSEKTLDEKINQELDCGKLYTPTREEWRNATRLQRKYMTWPRELLAQIKGE